MIVSLPLALLFALAALFSAGELVWQHGQREIVSYVADCEAQATHLVMNGGMAVMVAPFYAAGWATGLQIVFGLGIVVLAVRLVALRGLRPPGRGAGTIYHIVGFAAMIWATRLMGADMPAAMSGMAPMAPAAHGRWIAAVLAVAFALDGLATAALAAFAPMTMIRMARLAAGETDDDTRPIGSLRRTVRVAAAPHIVMNAGMVLMLWPLAAG